MRLSNNAIMFCEKEGVYEIYKEKGNVITYYSFYSDDLKHPFIKVVYNLKTGKEMRKRLRYRTTPKFLKGEYGNLYNYCTG